MTFIYRPFNVLISSLHVSGYPLHRENRGEKSLSGKTQGIWKICQNTQKTQEIWSVQVVNSLILMVKDISIFATKIPPKYFEAGYVYQVSLVYVIVMNHGNWHRENLQSDRENTRNLKMKFEWVPFN